MTNLGSLSFNPCASQAAIQDVDGEKHFRVRPSPILVCNSSAWLLHMRPPEHWLYGRVRGGRGNAVLTRFRLHRPATEPSVYGQIPRDVTDVTTCL